jgi:hypothetical protein
MCVAMRPKALLSTLFCALMPVPPYSSALPCTLMLASGCVCLALQINFVARGPEADSLLLTTSEHDTFGFLGFSPPAERERLLALLTGVLPCLLPLPS